MKKNPGAKNWWLEEHDAILKSEYADCESVTDLSSRLGHSPASVTVRAKRLGLHRNWKHKTTRDPTTGKTVRFCLRCETSKPLDDFYPKQYLCKPCFKIRNTEYRRANSDRLREACKVRYQKDKNRRRYERIRVGYGLTQDQYDQMHHLQGGRCAICGRDESSLARGLAVDHDHKSGKIRALLCSYCNTAIGSMGDNPDLLLKAAIYLEKHR